MNEETLVETFDVISADGRYRATVRCLQQWVRAGADRIPARKRLVTTDGKPLNVVNEAAGEFDVLDGVASVDGMVRVKRVG